MLIYLLAADNPARSLPLIVCHSPNAQPYSNSPQYTTQIPSPAGNCGSHKTLSPVAPPPKLPVSQKTKTVTPRQSSSGLQGSVSKPTTKHHSPTHRRSEPHC